MTLDLTLFFSFLASLLYLGLRKSKAIASEEGYLLADRNTSLFSLTATLVMTELNTATLIAFSSLGYMAGGWAMSLPCIFLIGLLFYALTVAKKWKEFDRISVASFFSERYGKGIGIFASIALLLAMAGFSAAYVKSLYLLFTPIFPNLNSWLLSGVLVATVLLLVVRGGLISIIRTDVFTFLIAIVFFPLMAYFSYRSSFGEAVVIENPKLVVPFKFVLSLMVLTMFTYILAPWYGQKIFAARSKKVAYLSVIFSAIIVFVLYGLGVMTTWFFKENGGIAPSSEQALPFAMNLVLPVGLRGLGYGILFAASATTLTGVWSAMSSLVIGDFFSSSENRGPQRGITLTVLFAVTSFFLANLLVDKVFDKLILANIPVAALSFALLGGFYWKKASRMGACMSMIVGWGWALFCYFYYGMEGEYIWYWAIGGIPAVFIAGVLFSLLCPNKSIVYNY